MNTYFPSVGEKLARELPPSIMPLLSSDSLLLPHPPPPTLERCAVTFRSQVDRRQRSATYRHIKQMKSNKATGADAIEIYPLARHWVRILRLFRWSIDHQTVYGSWKLARLPPIFKKDDRTDPGNYRPVSLLSVPSKLLESEINTAIVDHVTTTNNLTSDSWYYSCPRSVYCRSIAFWLVV